MARSPDENTYERGDREFKTIVRAIQGMAKELAPSCLLYGTEEYSTDLRVALPYNQLFRRRLATVSEQYPDGNEAREKAWNLTKGKLVEVLSVVGTFRMAERPPMGDIWNLFGCSGPIAFLENGERRYLWTQPFVKGGLTGLAARLDIAVTSDPQVVSPNNLLRVVECKCARALGARTLREEFGKAQDFRIESYLIWSYYAPRPKMLTAAENFRIDLKGIGLPELLDTYEADPGALARFVVDTLADVASNKRFLR